MNAAMLHTTDSLPNGHFVSLFLRELPNGQFELIEQRLQFVGNDHTMSEYVLATGTILEIMRFHSLGESIQGHFPNEPTPHGYKRGSGR